MNRTLLNITFTLDERYYALDVNTVERITQSVEITPLPKAPDIVLGIVNYHGKIIPVVNIRRRFHLPEKETEPTDQLIIARTLKRTVALLVDTVLGVIETSEDAVVQANTIMPGLDYVQGVVKLDDGMVIIYNLDKFLSLDEGKSLDIAVDSLKGAQR
jgi:purine-binding chemotaxis protein CheW